MSLSSTLIHPSKLRVEVFVVIALKVVVLFIA